MKVNKMIIAILPLSLLATHSYAFFCPSNFSQIDIGYTIDQVTQACGKPDKQDTKDGEANGPQQWDYYLLQGNSLNAASSQPQGSLKATIAFDANGKVVNITINGIGVGSTSLCGRAVTLGATRDEVKAACGTPGFINKQDPSTTGGAKPADKITTFIYNSNPPVTLTFTNGVLTGK